MEGYDATTYYGGGRDSKTSKKNKNNSGPSPMLDSTKACKKTGHEGLIEENRRLRAIIRKLESKISQLESK